MQINSKIGSPVISSLRWGYCSGLLVLNSIGGKDGKWFYCRSLRCCSDVIIMG